MIVTVGCSHRTVPLKVAVENDGAGAMRDAFLTVGNPTAQSDDTIRILYSIDTELQANDKWRSSYA
jgi:hypothetical protein